MFRKQVALAARRLSRAGQAAGALAPGRQLAVAAAAVSGAGRASGRSRDGQWWLAAAAAGSAAALLAASQQRRSTRCDVPPADAVPPGHLLVLSADCGGTTTRLRLYAVDPDEPIKDETLAPGTLLVDEKYANLFYKSLDEIITHFVRVQCGENGARPTVAVLAVAGVVTDNRCRYTNLDWIVDGCKLAKNIGIDRVEVINDFVAQGYGMLTLSGDEVEKLNDVQPRSGAPIGCIGAGTGLGNCFLIADNHGTYHCFPSEGGHVEFAPRGEGNDTVQIDLLKYLKIKFSGWNRISVERVVSGKGICNIYEFLAYTFPKRVNKAMHKEFLAHSGDAGIVAKHASEPGSLCEEAIDIFASCYGAAVGSMAIQIMPFRGLYITGGVSKKLSHILSDPDGKFMTALRDKGRVTPLLDLVPIYLVKNDDMGQRGAHRRAVQLLKEHLCGECRIVDVTPLDRDHLVPPSTLSYGGDANVSREVSELIMAARNRRLPVGDEENFDPIFKSMLWRLPRTGCRTNEEDWMHREMWIAHNKNLCYRSQTTREGLVYWTSDDLRQATVEAVESDDPSCKEFTFVIKVEGFQPSFFAADTKEGRDFWIQNLRNVCGAHGALSEAVDPEEKQDLAK